MVLGYAGLDLNLKDLKDLKSDTRLMTFFKK